MIESLLLFLQTNVLPLGAWGVFLASVIEEVVAPIPSALVMMTSGFIFITGPVDVINILKLIFVVVVPATLGVTIGSFAVYGLAWWGGQRILTKWGKWLGLYWSDVEKLENKLKESKKDEIIIIIARVIPMVPSVAISAFCGFVRMNIIKYTWITLVGIFIRCLILASVGWQVGNVYYRYAELVSRLEKYILISILIVVLLLILNIILRRYRWLARKDEGV